MTRMATVRSQVPGHTDGAPVSQPVLVQGVALQGVAIVPPAAGASLSLSLSLWAQLAPTCLASL
jgi:hypothetical protein